MSEAETRAVHSPYALREADLAVFFPRQAALANAAKWLLAKGYSLKPRNGRIYVEDSELTRIAQQLDEDIKRLGGHRLARHLIDPRLGGQHAWKARQYLGKLPWASTPDKQPEPLVPVGYLLNLAVKHLNEPIITIGREDGSRLLDDILERARMIAAIYDAQPYDRIHEIAWPRHEFIEKLIDYARFDRLFTVPDCRPSDVPRTLIGLFGWIDDYKLGWTAGEAARFAEGCLSLGRDNIGPNLISESRIRQTVWDIRPGTLTRLLDICSHEQFSVNHGFLLPDKLPTKKDFMFKPLIKIGKQDYCLMHSSWCAPAFYEALAMDLRNAPVADTDKRIGIALEEFVRSVMESKGIACIHGNYHVGDIQGDCDAVVETTDTILLFEVKKKPLRRSSRAGDELTIMVDFAKGLIYGMYELTKQALVLQESGELLLTTDGTTFRLESKGRAVERVYVSLDGYGGLQDRVLTEKLLEFAYSTGLGAREKYRRELETIDNCSIKLRQHQRRLAKADPSRYSRPFFDCRFLSLPYLLYILDDVSSNDSLRQVLWTNRPFSLGTRDLYNEYAYAKAMKTEAQSKKQI